MKLKQFLKFIKFFVGLVKELLSKAYEIIVFIF